MKKYLLLTHRDLDGVGCAFLATTAFNDVDIEYHDYNTINDSILKLTYKDIQNYDRIFITDISVNAETACIINTLNMDSGYDRFVLIDHHKTAMHLSNYDWATICESIDGELSCGTRLFYNYLCKHSYFVKSSYLGATSTWIENFVEMVNRYDTWLWCTKYDDELPKKLNQLLYIVGFNNFLDDICDKHSNDASIFSRMDLKLLEIEENKISSYIKSKNKTVKSGFMCGYKAGFVIAEQYTSELGNALSELNPQYDLIAVFNGKNLSLRTVKDNVDCSYIASNYGGGGHPKASGISIPNNQTVDIFKMLLASVTQ